MAVRKAFNVRLTLITIGRKKKFFKEVESEEEEISQRGRGEKESLTIF